MTGVLKKYSLNLTKELFCNLDWMLNLLSQSSGNIWTHYSLQRDADIIVSNLVTCHLDNTNDIFKEVGNRTTTIPIHFYGMGTKSMGTGVINIFFCSAEVSNRWQNFSFWVNFPFQPNLKHSGCTAGTTVTLLMLIVFNRWGTKRSQCRLPTARGGNRILCARI